MAAETILTITKINLSSQGPEQGVTCFRELLWAEASAMGLPKTAVNVPGDINDPDGGVDAEVQNDSTSVGQGIIKKGLTCYQVKTGKSNPTTESEIKKLLFKKKKSKKDKQELKPEVKRCLEENGTFIVVHFGWDGPNSQVKKAVQSIKSQLKGFNNQYKDAKVDLFPQNMLIGFFGQFVPLTLALNGNANAIFQTHNSWSKDAQMQKSFVSGSDHENQMESIRQELRKFDNPVHIHVVGEPGIGKTRLVLEATIEEDIKPLVLYCNASDVLGSVLLNELLKDDTNLYAILVVDECDDKSRAFLWNKLQSRSPRIKLISIYNESKGVSGITFIESPRLSRDEIKKIIEIYGVPDLEAGRWAELCGNSPRVAHVVGENLKKNPDDILKTPSTVEVWDRFIAGGNPPDSPQVADRRLVLQHIALFKRYGYGQSLMDEAKAISKIINEANPQITWAKFQQIVTELRARKLLQGSNTLYITPKLLHIKLWSDWWKTYGDDFDLNEFAAKLPPKTNLVDWFLEMFEYARESQIASNLVKQLLGPDGPFKNTTVLQGRRASFFFRALASASPEEALKCLQRIVGNCTKEQLLEFEDGRREVIYALEHIVFYKELFLDAARILLKLAEAENETWGNNASGVFTELFSPAYGLTASTSVPPLERLPVLIEALDSDSPEIRRLALNACDEALEAEHFTRFSGQEFAGIKKAPDGWMPKTYGELWDGYRRVWQLLHERLPAFKESDRVTAVSIMLTRSGGLFRRTKLADTILPSLEDIVAKGYTNKKEIIKTLVEVIHYEGKELQQEVLTKLEQLKEKLEGTGFSSELQRYVGMDLFEDDYDDEGNRVNQNQQRIKELAQQALVDKKQLEPELHWLVTAEAKNGLLFGYELGLADTNFDLLQDLLEAQKNAKKDGSPFFLCGYFRALSERDKPRWENELDNATKDSKLLTLVPELTWRSGPLTDRAAQRVLHLIEEGILGYENLRLFSYGSVISDLSEEVFIKWINLLLKICHRDAIAIALDLHSSFYRFRNKSKHELPEELTFKLLTHPTLFETSNERRGPMDEYHWSETGKLFVMNFPEKSLELAELMLEHFGEKGTIIDDTYSSPIEVLDAIVQKFPEHAWDQIKKYLVSPIDSRAFHITHWLRGDEHSKQKGGVIQLIPPQKLWEWVDENVSKRARYLTSMVPNTLFWEEGKTCLAREILACYGGRDDVRNAMMANFSTESYRGPESSHLEEKKNWLHEFKAGESNQNVRRWIDEYIAILDKSIQRATIAEERGEF